jgi:deoxyadenosine/deoxycytidine kinase
MKVITIEGNIGTGKSTLLDALKGVSLHVPHVVVPENIHDWVKPICGDQNLFDKFYKDPERFAFMFQSYLLASKSKYLAETMRSVEPGTLLICERSMYTDINVFARTLFDNKHMTDVEYHVYKETHDTIVKLLDVDVCGHVYLRSSPDVCMHRIAKRARKSEERIRMPYIQQLHNAHERWLMCRPDVTTLVVDADCDHDENPCCKDMILDNVVEYIRGIV